MVQKQLVTCEMVKLESVLLYLKKKKRLLLLDETMKLLIFSALNGNSRSALFPAFVSCPVLQIRMDSRMLHLSHE